MVPAALISLAVYLLSLIFVDHFLYKHITSIFSIQDVGFDIKRLVDDI